MSRRLLVAAVCILLLPFWFSASPPGTAKDSPGGNLVVFAGHTSTGRSCTCGTTDCICDPGEQQRSIVGTEPELKQTKLGKHGVTGSRGKAESSGFGQLGLLFALALLFWRLRS